MGEGQWVMGWAGADDWCRWRAASALLSPAKRTVPARLRSRKHSPGRYLGQLWETAVRR